MNSIKTYGFIESPIENEHWLLGDGSIVPLPLQTGGHGWGSFLPQDQLQNKNGLETENCTSYGTIHALATLGNRKFGASFQHNLSERYLGIMSGTTINGNDPHRVAETIRTGYGVIPDTFLPFDATITSWQQYYSPKPMTYWRYAIGNHWINKKYTFNHQWVFLPQDSIIVKQQKMIDALQYSPLGASVFAWSQHDDGLYYSDMSFQNHWVTIYDYEQGKSWSAFDSYDNTHKLLDWNFTFGQAKMYSLDYKTGGQNLGDMPTEQVYLPYTLYLGLDFIKNIMQ